MSRVRAYRKLDGASDLGQVQDYIEYVLQPLLKCPLIDGTLLENLDLATGPNIVDHKLGREPRGWYIVSPKANESVWQTASTRSSLTLNASGPITLSLWCF